MLTVREAQDSLLAGIRPLSPILVPLLESLGGVLARDVYADISNPPFDNSGVDGYAVLSTDTRAASPEQPVRLSVIEEVAAGAVPVNSVTRGKCIKIMTGAPIPPGADSVIMVEDTQTCGSDVDVLNPSTQGDHVRRAGEDIRAGDRVLSVGSVIGSAEIALLAAMGQAEVSLHRRPRVAIISTGNELVEINQMPEMGQIRNSNSYALAALVTEAGAAVHSIRHVPDDPDETERAFRECSGLDGGDPADIIVTSGGVSVGDHDYVKPALERLGELSFWRVNMKPGKPIAFGRIVKSLFFGLPGNPISTMVTFELFVRPAIRKLAGHSELRRPRVSVSLEEEIVRHPGREEYVRAVVTATESGLRARVTGAQGSGVLTSMIGANSLLVLPPDSKSFAAGDTATAMLLGAPKERDA